MQVVNWHPEIEQALEQLFSQPFAVQPAVAVFDADETLWRHDVGEGFLQWLQAQGELKIPPEEDAFARYLALCAENTTIGYAYCTQVMAGMQEKRLKELAQTFFQEHFAQNVYSAQKALIKRLEQAGVAVWLVSASNQWIVDAGAPALGIAPERVVGVRLKVVDGILTDEIIPPLTYRQGKVEAIQKYIGCQPVLVAGDSMTDYEMLCYASQLCLVINPKNQGEADQNIFSLAGKHQWPVQAW